MSQAVGIPAMLAAVVLLAAAASSVVYTVYRFDRMQRSALELELMAEASYAEARGSQTGAEDAKMPSSCVERHVCPFGGAMSTKRPPLRRAESGRMRAASAAGVES